jgi:hypothetical protein
MNRRSVERLLVACCLLPAVTVANPVTDIVDTLQIAMNTTNRQVLMHAVVKLMHDEGSAKQVLSALRGASGKQRAKLAVLAGATLDMKALAELLTSTGGLVQEGSLERDILASAFLDRLLPVADGSDAPPMRPEERFALDGHSPRGTLALTVADVLCKDPNWRNRRIAARTLNSVKTDTMRPSHRVLLQDPAWPVREYALRSLACLQSSESEGILLGILEHACSRRERLVAVGVMADMGCEQGLRSALLIQDEDIQLEAARGMEHLEVLNPMLRESLTRALRKTKNDKVRKELQALLERDPPASEQDKE